MDADAVRACARAGYSQYISAIGREPAPMVADFEAQIAAGWVQVAEVDGKIAGFIVFYPQGDDMMLENVCVNQPGRGLGRALIASCEAQARRQAIPRVILYTNEKMTGPLALYPRLGYVETDRRQDDGFARVYFEKLL